MRYLTAILSALLVVMCIITGCQNAHIKYNSAPSSVSEESNSHVVLEQKHTPLTRFSWDLLEEATPAGEAAGLSIYLCDNTGSFLQELDYGEHQIGKVIAAYPGEDGYIIGKYDTDKDQWGTVSPLGDNLICFNNYNELAFIDTQCWENTGFTLDFQVPEEPNYRISSVARDQDSGNFAVIYQVSSYIVSSDGKERPWLTYDNSDIGADDAHMEIQLFDKDGTFAKKVVTDLEPLVMNDVADCLPNRYANNTLVFLQKSYIGKLVTCDLNNGKISLMPCDGAVLTDNAEIIYRHDESVAFSGGVFTYGWYEKERLISSLSFGEERDSLTLGIGNSIYPLKAESINTENRTLEMSYRGLIYHKLDFNAKTADVVYEYPEESFGDPILTSPDGRYHVYRFGEFSGGEAYFEELAARDTETGDFIRIGMVNNASRMVITGKKQLAVLYFDRMEVFDLLSREWYTPLERFSVVENESGNKIKAIDLIYDYENKLTLVLSTSDFDPFDESFNEDMIGPIYLEIYNEGWEHIRTIDTGITAPYSLKSYGPYSPGVILGENGYILLGKGETIINYME